MQLVISPVVTGTNVEYFNEKETPFPFELFLLKKVVLMLDLSTYIHRTIIYSKRFAGKSWFCWIVCIYLQYICSISCESHVGQICNTYETPFITIFGASVAYKLYIEALHT